MALNVWYVTMGIESGGNPTSKLRDMLSKFIVGSTTENLYSFVVFLHDGFISLWTYIGY